jgi:hypothetical protein
MMRIGRVLGCLRNKFLATNRPSQRQGSAVQTDASQAVSTTWVRKNVIIHDIGCELNRSMQHKR